MSLRYLCAVAFNNKKEKVNNQEAYGLYQLCNETRELREFCVDYEVDYGKFMSWQRHQQWSEK